jgi:hypothetical protein
MFGPDSTGVGLLKPINGQNEHPFIRKENANSEKLEKTSRKVYIHLKSFSLSPRAMIG